MKANDPFTCRFCGTALAGSARECILCFSKNTAPCPKCVVIFKGGRQQVRRNAQSGREISCKLCANKRFTWIGDKDDE